MPRAVLDAEERVAAYPDVSDTEAAEQIVSRYGLSLQGEDTPARQAEDGQLLIQRGTDWSFLRRLAGRNGFVCYFEYDPAADAVAAHFKRPALKDPPQADLTILRENNNLRWIDFQLAMAAPVRAVGAAIDPINKRLVRSDGAPELAPLGESGLADAIEDGVKRAGGTAAQALLRDPFPSDAAINAHGTGATDVARFVLEARGEVDPALYRGLLRARRTVLIKGVGARLSGIYYVRSVRTVLEEAASARPSSPGAMRSARAAARTSGRAPRRCRPNDDRRAHDLVRRARARPLVRQVRGVVTETDDPRGIGRLRARVPAVLGEEVIDRMGAAVPQRSAAARIAASWRCPKSATPCGSSSPPATCRGRSGPGPSGAPRPAPADRTISQRRPAPRFRHRRATPPVPRIS